MESIKAIHKSDWEKTPESVKNLVSKLAKTLQKVTNGA